MANRNKLPDMLKKEELIKIFDSIDRPKCSMACFMALMCGLRVKEICNLQIADIDLEKRIIKIRDSKNTNRSKQGYGKDRMIPLPECTISPIKKWLDIIQGGKWFMPSAKSPNISLRTKTLHGWFREVRKKAGLDQVEYVATYKKPTKNRKSTPVYKFRFHHFRHFYATYVYEKTGDIYVVSNLLGHNQITTTQIYARISDKSRKESVDFAFNNPIRTQMLEKRPAAALNYAIPEVAKRERTPLEVLNERLATGELSDIEYQNKIRLLALAQEHLKN